jgi:hypothetical protein
VQCMEERESGQHFKTTSTCTLITAHIHPSRDGCGDAPWLMACKTFQPLTKSFPNFPPSDNIPTQRILLAPTMFFRFKLLILVVLASSAILSVQAHNGEHEHGDGVVMSVTDGNGKTIFDGENETRAKKETPDRPSSKREPRAADSELEGQADDGAESETRSLRGTTECR